MTNSLQEEEDKLEVDSNEESRAQPIKQINKYTNLSDDSEENIKASFVQTNIVTHKNKIEKRYITEATQTADTQRRQAPIYQVNYQNCIIM